MFAINNIVFYVDGVRLRREKQQTKIQSKPAHTVIKRLHVQAQCYAYMRPSEIQHDKSNFIE